MPVALLVVAAVVVVALFVVVGAVLGLTRPSAAAQSAVCIRGATRLNVLSAPDAAPVLRRLGAQFSRTGQDSSGRCVDVRVTAQDSAAATAVLAQVPTGNSADAPAVWMPDASMWLKDVERQRAASRLAPVIASGPAPSVARSPLVVAMPKPMATALGWPKKPIRWRDLLTASRSPAGWGEHGHVEWGRFTLGETDPRTSQSGLEATIAAYAAAKDGGGALTLPDVYSTSARRFVAGVQQGVERFSSSDVEYLKDIRRADDAGRALTGVSALVTREDLVVAYDRGVVGGTTRRPPKVPLVAVRPAEGTPIADHPYAMLRASWVGPRQQAAAAAFLHWLRTPDVQREWQEAGFRDAQGRAGTSPGTAEAGIGAQPVKAMRMPSSQVVSEILRSWSQLRKTANVLNLIDVSGSMNDPAGASRTSKLRAASDAARSAMQLFTDDDEVGLWTFSTPIGKGKDWQPLVPIGPMRERVGAAARRATIDADLAGLKVHGGTALYRSIEAAYEEVHARYRADRINAVVVLTDGYDSSKGRGPSLDELLAKLRSDPARPVRVLTIAYGKDVATDVLTRIAQDTGGANYTAPTTADIQTAYASVLSNF